MPINAHPDYLAAEAEYLRAVEIENKIEKLKKMISLAPSHKGGENLRAQLKTRLRKLLEKKEKDRKKGKSSKKGIKKEEMQVAIIGKTNSGKSSLLRILTNSEPNIAEYEFTTKTPNLGMMNYGGTNIQLIEIPAIGSEFYDKGLVNSADTILILITSLDDLKGILDEIKTEKKKIIVFNKIDLLGEEEKRKITATLASKKYNFVLISSLLGGGSEQFRGNEKCLDGGGEQFREGWVGNGRAGLRIGVDGGRAGLRIGADGGLKELKNKIFQSFNKIRIYTKEPGKEKSNRPIILNPNSTVRDVAEKILKGFSDKVRETKIWGPSSKFPGQKVGLSHKLKDLDVVEFKTK